VAKHKYGCRVLERLIEHCSEAQLTNILQEITANSEALCRHPFGNFVVQHLLEHGSDARRRGVLECLLPKAPELAMHRTASHVVQRVLDHCDESGQNSLIVALLNAVAPNSLLDVARSRYGSYVAEQLADFGNGPFYNDVKQCFTNNLKALALSQYGSRVAKRFGLETARTLPDVGGNVA